MHTPAHTQLYTCVLYSFIVNLYVLIGKVDVCLENKDTNCSLLMYRYTSNNMVYKQCDVNMMPFCLVVISGRNI